MDKLEIPYNFFMVTFFLKRALVGKQLHSSTFLHINSRESLSQVF